VFAEFVAVGGDVVGVVVTAFVAVAVSVGVLLFVSFSSKGTAKGVGVHSKYAVC